MKTTIPTYIGVSSSLSINAPGHYLPFHGKLFEEFKIQNPQSIYIGAESADNPDLWWTGWAPHSLRSRPNFLGLRKFVQLCQIARNLKNPYFVVYEGSLFHLCIFTCVSAFSNSSALINLHYSSELSAKMRSQLGKLFVKSIFKLSRSLSSGAVVITSESDELSSEIERRIGIFPKPFPVFSVLDEIKSSEIVEVSHTWVICRVVHPWQLENLISALKDNPNEIFLINGLNEKQKMILQELHNVRIQDQYLTPQEYRTLLAGSKQIVLAYDTEMYKGHSSGRLLDAMIFGKQILAIEGMPIPLFARNYQNLQLVKFAELGLSLRNFSPQVDASLQFKPNASWAVSQIRNMFPKEDSVPEFSKRRPCFLPIVFFGVFYFLTLFSRGFSAVMTRFLRFSSKK